MSLIVLMSTYNGEKYLRQQLDSLLSQELLPNRILIRDDGSSDSTLDILKEYKNNNKIIDYYQESNKGPAKSFWELISNCDEYDYYALCDQDDFWFSDKLKVAVDALNKEDKNIPLLYCSRYTLTDKNLNPIETNISSLYNYTDFSHALLYQTAPGCTFVFNNEARKKIIEYDINKNYCMIHDSMIHKIVTMFGKMVLDESSHLYYRQHGDNAIGLTGNLFKTFVGRIKNFISGNIKNTRSKMAFTLLNVYGDSCLPENKEIMEIVANYQEKYALKRKLLSEKRFEVEGINYLFFKILVLVNYI